MKKIIFAIVAALTFSLNTVAQKYGPWDMFVGPRAGIIANKITSVNGDVETGMLFGVNAEVFFSGKVSLNMGVNFTHQGGNNVNKENTGVYDYDLEYINTEFTCRYYPMSRFCFFTGIDLGRVVKSRIEGKEGRRKLTDFLHKGSVCFPVGVAANYKNVELNLAYRYQVNKIARSSFTEYLGDARNSSLSLSIIYKVQIF